jgi:hypothetical protein
MDSTVITSWFRGLTVMTADSDSASEGSTPSETCMFGGVDDFFFPFAVFRC